MEKIQRTRPEGNVHVASSALRLLRCIVCIAQGQNGFVASKQQVVSAASREKLHTWIHLAQVSFKAQGQLAIAFKECLVRRALPIRLMKAVSLSLDWNWSCRFPS